MRFTARIVQSHAAGAVIARQACLGVAALLLGCVAANAQVSADFAEGSLAPAAEEMAAAGVDGSGESLATLIEIAQRHGFGYDISPDEVRELFGSGYLAVGQIDCSSLDSKAAAAQRLSRALSAIAWLYAAGAGLTYVAPPVAAALGFGALVSGIGAAVAGWVAADLRSQRSRVNCSSGGGIEWFRPAAPVIRTSVDPAALPFSWRRSSGASAWS